MVGLRGRVARWDRFARLAPGAAMLVIAFALLLLAAAALTPRTDRTPVSAPESSVTTMAPRDKDLALYDEIARRVGAGEAYYRVAVEEQRARDFPVRPGLSVRLPTLAVLFGWLGTAGMAVLAGVLAVLTLGAWWLRLGEEPGGEERRTIGLLLLVIGTGTGLKLDYLVLHEVWAGLLLALAFGLHRPGKWGLAWLAAAAALAIREHALPFVLLLAAMAAWRRDWRETAAWGVLALAFVIGLLVHLGQVNLVLSPADPVAPSWLVFRGLGGWTANVELSTALHLLPGWLAAPLVLLPLLGWAAWKTDAGLTGLLLFAGYGLLFMIAGGDDTFYWALMVTPCWFIGLAFVPRAVRSLVNSARGL
ncbi:hypothetical protein M3P36_10340 [Altererythrobacter sp. KTW20L]|uniref:hypothetical protein n=1 Tax=Altererythrobacter sp. KTW20L TaxID=2942210 RepID=UPI0020BE1885|nr:hypothetical protein [Altererythrobacter sp. KTW20L]MCL6251436.1 hypothetical protein [Altererythrobacter sp. KTW20L]